MRRALLALLFACGLACAPATRALEILGVGTHLAQGAPEATVSTLLKSFPSLGIRDEVYWNQFERTPGQYRPTPNLSAALRLACAPERAAKSVLVLGYGNPLYDEGRRPRSPEALQAYAEYAVKVAQLCPAIGQLEIWNEWNLATGVSKAEGAGSADDYVALVRQVVPRLRAAGFAGRILLGGIAGDHPDWAFTRQVIAAGVLPLADGYSVHLYNFARALPDRPDEMMTRLKRLHELLAAAVPGREMPVYITETGWPVGTGKPMLASAEAGADLMQSLLTFSTLPWLRGVWVYQLHDRRRSADVEDNFGLFDAAGNPRMTACALQWFSENVWAAGSEVKPVAGKRTLAFNLVAPHDGALRQLVAINPAATGKPAWQLPAGAGSQVQPACGGADMGESGWRAWPAGPRATAALGSLP